MLICERIANYLSIGLQLVFNYKGSKLTFEILLPPPKLPTYEDKF